DVALAGRGAADEGVRLEGVDTEIRGSRAVIGGVVIARAGLRGAGAGEGARLERISRAGARGPRAAFRDVALARRGAADEGVRLEGVNTEIRGSRAVIGGVVIARAGLRGAGAGEGARLERISRTGAPAPRAADRDVALAGRGAADEGVRLE